MKWTVEFRRKYKREYMRKRRAETNYADDRSYYKKAKKKKLIAQKLYRNKEDIKERRRQYNRKWVRTLTGRFFNAHKKANRWSQVFELSFTQYEHLVSQPCYYCGTSLENMAGIGLDRKDNSKGYSIENVLPCCGKCNRIRGDDLTVEEMKVAMTAIMCHRKI